MLEEIREYIGSLYVLCENIAELDVVTTFAQIGKTLTYVRPIFSNNRTDVRGSVHPILNRVSTSKPVANDIVRIFCIVTVLSVESFDAVS